MACYRIVVDGVINHMVKLDEKFPGTYGNGIWSSAGSDFDGTHYVDNFPAVPYSKSDFNDNLCDRDIQQSDYTSNAWAVRNCRLDSLLDLNHGNPWVQQQISAYFNKVIDLGVAGIRIDACKHMWPDYILAILGQVNNLNSTVFGPSECFLLAGGDSGLPPWVFQTNVPSSSKKSSTAVEKPSRLPTTLPAVGSLISSTVPM